MGTSRLQKSKCFSGVTFSKPSVLQLMLSSLGARQHSLVLVNMICMILFFTVWPSLQPQPKSLRWIFFGQKNLVSPPHRQHGWEQTLTIQYDPRFPELKRKKSEQNIITVFLPFSSGWKSINNINLHFLGGGILPMLSHEGPRMEDLYFT